MRSLSRFVLFAVVVHAVAAGAEIPRRVVKITDAEYVNDGTQIRVIGFRSKARYELSCDVSYWNAHRDLLGSCDMPEIGRTYKLLPLTRKGAYYILPSAGAGGSDLVFTLTRSSTKR